MAVSLPRQNYDLMSRESNGMASYEYETMTLVKNETLKRSLVKEEIADEGLGMNRKDRNESDNEPDGEPAAKMRRGGGGRRKQSKPMRMFADLEVLPESEPSQASSNHQDSELRILDEVKSTDCQMVNLLLGSFVCELCHESCETDDALKDHVDRVHAVVPPDLPTKGTVVHTKYHLLGKELKQQDSDFILDRKPRVKEINSAILDKTLADEEDTADVCKWTQVKKEDEKGIVCSDGLNAADQSHHFAVKPSSESFLARHFSTEDESQLSAAVNIGPQIEKPRENNGGKQMPDFEAGIQGETHPPATATVAAASASWDPNKSRIFHPDAYCEICDREFCNKYFLKTHKANKHGIYDSNVPGMELSTAVSSDLFFNMLSRQQQQERPSATPPKTSPHKPSGGDSNSCSASFPLPSASGASSAAEDSGSVTPIKSSSSESDECCEFCQKHFLSKNQLKRHKQEVHGFLQGSESSKRSNVTGLSSGSPNAIPPLSASIEIPPISHPMLLPHMTATSNSAPTALSEFSRMANLSNLMFLNPFNSPLAVIPPLFPTPGLGFRPNALALPQMPQQDVQKSTNSSRFPADGSALPNTLLQSMGVLNAETLMELYRKEFCSNYLMRSQEVVSSRASGLFPTGITGFQSGLPTSIAGGMTFPLPGKPGNQDSALNNDTLLLKKDKYEMPAENCEVCEICKKTFLSKQSLVSHLLTAHNTKPETCDLATELMKLDKLNEEHHFEKAMFGNMVAAKLVDRVQCDICNKEVCNKYFLKTHKIKVHGWDPVSGEREAQEKATAKQPSPLHTQSIGPDASVAADCLMNVERPKEEELLQMGIDPEAYCEICKKEFCNKYFLKTHKQNIHGIKTTTANPMESRTNATDNWNYVPPPPPPPPPAPLPPQPNSLTATQLSLLTGSQPLQSFAPVLNPPPSLMPVLDQSVHDGAVEKRSWKWKEPVNAMRVTCEICNKVLCNKYFLKTHMMKRHGVNYDTITGQLMTSAKSQALSEYMSVREDSHGGPDDLSASQQSVLQSIEKQHPFDVQATVRHGALPERDPVAEERVGEIEDDTGFTDGRAANRNDGENSHLSEVEKRTTLAVNLVLSETSKALDLTYTATTVLAKTWRVPSDDQEFDGRASDSESHPSGFTSAGDIGSQRGAVAEDSDVFFGDKAEALKRCDVDEAPGLLIDDDSPLSSSFEENRMAGFVPLSNATAPGKFDGSAPETAKAAIANHIRSQQKKRMFRCTHCRERFQQRSDCESHIRSVHPRLDGPGLIGHHPDCGSERSSKKQSNAATNESSSSTNPLEYFNGYANTKPLNFTGDLAESRDSIFGSDIVSKRPVTYAQPIDQTNLSNILMQPFLLKEVGGENRFAASLVYLPALQKINEPVSVTFSLTPILQH